MPKAVKKSSKIKNFVIDTNVILYSPKALETFDDNNIYIPAIVLEELDSFKKGVDLNGYNAREFIRKIEDYRTGGDLLKGVKMESGATLFISFHDRESKESVPEEFSGRRNDNLILGIAKKLQNESKNETIIISKDVNLRVKANALGIKAEDYYHERMGSFTESKDDTLYVPDSYINMMYQESELPMPDYIYGINMEEFSPRINEYFLMKSEVDEKKGVLVKYFEDEGEVKGFKRVTEYENIFGISPANRKQKYLMEALLDPDIDVVFAIGIAGTGKTLLALCAGMYSVLNEGTYKKMLVTRSPIPMGRDLGYLPGSISEKLDPWLKPIYDNLDFIIGNSNKEIRDGKDGIYYKSQMNNITIDYLKASNILEIEALTYIRGRTLIDTYVVIDEAQNLSPHEMKTIITRAGHNTKIVFTGDLKQIDNPYLNEWDNGLINASEKFTQARFRHCTTVFLDKGERSRLATEAARVL
ncbi:MAG: PhoH family protein [Geovibrio sp.]|nr:PhoH family protein [Geovibrio sp.]